MAQSTGNFVVNNGNSMKLDLLNEIVNRRSLGDKKFHSESSLVHLEEVDEPKSPDPDVNKDPGVQNPSMNESISPEEHQARRRTMSQPGPVSGSLVTATAARAVRRRPPRSVNYVLNLERSESDRVPRTLVPKTSDDSGTATPTGDRSSRNGDLKSLNSYRLYIPTSTPTPTGRKRFEMNIDAVSMRSVASVETLAPPPTNPEQNKKLTRIYVTKVASSMYAIILVTLGLIVNVGDQFLDAHIAPIFSIILASMGLIYHVYLMSDIARYKSAALKNQKMKMEHETEMANFYRKHGEDYNDGESPSEMYRPPTGLPTPKLMPLQHDYCFNQGRHSGSFYLKLGAAGFALGSLVHSVLQITTELGYIFDENIENEECVKFEQVAMDIVTPIYCFTQLFFVFKYSNVIIIKNQGLAHFAFMHMIGSSLCFWISAIVRETVLALTLYAQSLYAKKLNSSDESSEELDEYFFITKDSGSGLFINVSHLYNENCVGPSALSTIVESISPYLYPFSVEFNILIVAVYYIIWSNIGHCNNDEPVENSDDDSYSICKIPTASEDNDFTSNLVIYADCHASNKGLFLGLIVMVFITGMLIVGFVFSSVGGDFLEIGYLMNDTTRLGLHTLMLFAAILAFIQTVKLDINEHPTSLLDDILLFICLPPFVVETVFSLAATLSIINVIKSVDFCVMVIQVLVQTPLIMDGLRRCSNTRKLRRSKPGRELMMFLIISNVGMWMFYTFSYKSPESLDERYAYYGKVLWTILGHFSLPLIMFYRFHSSVCFADIWDSAYKPGTDH